MTRYLGTGLVRFGAVASFVTLAGLALSACSMFSKTPTPGCPRVQLLADVASTTVFQSGPGRDLTDVVYEAEIVNYKGECEFTNKMRTAVVSYTISLAVTRGPAAAPGIKVDVPFFVAVVDRNDQSVLARESFVTSAELSAGRRRVVMGEEIEQRIPLTPARGTQDIEIILGLELSAEQLEFNRRRKQ